VNDEARKGPLYATAAYLAWGFAPIYWKQLSALPAIEVLAYRILCAFVLTFVALIALRQLPHVIDSLKQPRQGALLAASGLLIGVNWGIFIHAVNTEQIVDTSLGYFLAPLLNVALGVVIFRERLSPLRMFAVAMAAAGVAFLAYELGRIPSISLALAGSFAVYGVLKKWSTISPMGGLLAETGVLSAPAIGFLVLTRSEASAHFGSLTTTSLWFLLGSGIITAFPLICFASAARRMPLTTLGLFQYIAPSLSLILAVWLYGEPFTTAHTVAFSLIWSALALSSWEGFRVRQLAPEARSGVGR
jgi:chloramphenicol-sensitive protein RarD